MLWPNVIGKWQRQFDSVTVNLGIMDNMRCGFSVHLASHHRPPTPRHHFVGCPRSVIEPGAIFPAFPALRGHIDQPGPRAENAEQGKTEARWNLAIALPSVSLPTQRPETRLEVSPDRAATCVAVRQAFRPDIPNIQSGKPDVLKRRSSSDWPKLWRPRALANTLVDTRCGTISVIRRVPRRDRFRPLRARWHRNPFLPRAAERFGTAALRDKNDWVWRKSSTRKFCNACSLRYNNLSGSHPPREAYFGSIPNTVRSGTKTPKNTLCRTFSGSFFDFSVS